MCAASRHQSCRDDRPSRATPAQTGGSLLPRERRLAATDPMTRVLVTGGGGSGLYKVGKNPFTAASRSIYHFVRLHVDGCTLRAEAIEMRGLVFDTFSINKCGG